MSDVSRMGLLPAARWIGSVASLSLLLSAMIPASITLAAPTPSVPVSSCVFSPDGKSILCWGQARRSGQMWLLETATGKLRRAQAWTEPKVAQGWVYSDQVHSVAFARDGRTLAIAKSGVLRGQHTQGLLLWDVQRWELKQALIAEHVPWSPALSMLHGITFSPDGKCLAGISSGWGEPPVRIWDLATGKEKAPLRVKGQPHRLESIAFSPDGASLACGGVAQTEGQYLATVFLWDVAKGELVRTLTGRFSERHLAFSPDGKFLLATGWGNGKVSTVKVWDVSNGDLHRTMKFDHDQKEQFAAGFSPDGRLLAAPASGGVRIFDLQTGEGKRTLKATWGERSLPMVFSPDSTALATGGSRFLPPDIKVMVFGGMDLWDIQTEALRFRWVAPEAAPQADEQRSPPANPPRELKAEELDDLWALLIGDDAGKAYHAICTLIASPHQSIPFLRERLRPVPPLDKGQLTRWIANLDNNQFAVREKAVQELEKLGDLAEPALCQLLAGKPALEVSRRVEKLLEQIARRQLIDEALRSWRAIEVLENSGSTGAQQVLQSLVKGAPESRLTQEAQASLDRLARRLAAR